MARMSIAAGAAMVDGGRSEWASFREVAHLANCQGIDPDLFFPHRGASVNEARSVCLGCSIRPECFVEAVRQNEKYGVWGGTSERQRRSVRSQSERVLNMSREQIEMLLTHFDNDKAGRPGQGRKPTGRAAFLDAIDPPAASDGEGA